MFLLSKILFLFLAPFVWLLVLVICYFIAKKSSSKRKIKIAFICIFLFFSSPFIYHNFVIFYQVKPVGISKQQSFQVGILLGGLSGYDKQNKGFFSASSDRFIETVQLYHQGIIKKILISGGNGTFQNQPPETKFLNEEMIKNGVKTTDIILESNSRNTYENAIFSKQILDSLTLKGPYMLITSAIHMPRSIRLFQRAGMLIQPYPCDYLEIDDNRSLWKDLFPDIALLEKWKYIIKEIVGIFIYQMIGKA
jgi:uncharacterized SAM-binding protein YcdF (DUF218 family)